MAENLIQTSSFLRKACDLRLFNNFFNFPTLFRTAKLPLFRTLVLYSVLKSWNSLSIEAVKQEWITWQAAKDEYCVWEWLLSPRNLGPKRADTFHTVTDVVVSKEIPVNVEQRPVAPSASDQILMYTVIISILFYMNEVKSRLVLVAVTVQHKVVDNRLSAAIESFSKSILRKVGNSSKRITLILKSLIDSRCFIGPMAAFVKSKTQVNWLTKESGRAV